MAWTLRPSPYRDAPKSKVKVQIKRGQGPSGALTTLIIVPILASRNPRTRKFKGLRQVTTQRGRDPAQVMGSKVVNMPREWPVYFTGSTGWCGESETGRTKQVYLEKRNPGVWSLQTPWEHDAAGATCSGGSGAPGCLLSLCESHAQALLHWPLLGCPSSCCCSCPNVAPPTRTSRSSPEV